jgi:hypothetical protein
MHHGIGILNSLCRNPLNQLVAGARFVEPLNVELR